MNEAQRLVYLEALGIQQWVAKAPLANAKETEFLSGASQNKSILDFQTPKIEPQENISAHIKTLVKENIDTQVISLEAANSNKVETPHTLHSTEQTIDKEQVSKKQTIALPPCALQIQGKRGQYLLIADLQDVRGKVNVNEQNLLNNIAKAIDSLLANTSTSSIKPELFKWPLFESHIKAVHIDHGEQAAKESAQAFLYSRIKSHQLPLVIALGKKSHKLLGVDSLAINQHKVAHFGGTNFLLSVSLTDMMQNNAKVYKASLWEMLTQYFA